MSEKKFRVACYCRIATQNQMDDTPLQAQSTRLHRYAGENGLKIIGEVRAYEKGVSMDRPGWYNVLSLAAKKHADAILVPELGRVARDPWIVMETLKELSKQGLMVFASDYSLSCNTRLADKIKHASIALFQG